jgi:hypothetical protein
MQLIWLFLFQKLIKKPSKPQFFIFWKTIHHATKKNTSHDIDVDQ